MSGQTIFLIAFVITVLSPVLLAFRQRFAVTVPTAADEASPAKADTPKSKIPAKATQDFSQWIDDHRLLVAILVVIGGGILAWYDLRLFSFALAFYNAVTIVAYTLKKEEDKKKTSIFWPIVSLGVCLAWALVLIPALQGKRESTLIPASWFQTTKYMGTATGRNYTFSDNVWYQFDWPRHDCVYLSPGTGMQMDVSKKAEFIIAYKSRQGQRTARVENLLPGQTSQDGGFTCPKH